MRPLWNLLTEPERLVLMALHAGGASPRGPCRIVAPFLIQAIRWSGRWTWEAELALRHDYAEWVPLAEEFDDTLIGLVRRPPGGVRLVLGQGNYGSPDGDAPCHPLFRACRLRRAGEALVREAIAEI